MVKCMPVSKGVFRALRSKLLPPNITNLESRSPLDRMIPFVYGILAGIGSAISFGSFGECCSRAPQVADDFLAARELS